MFPKNGFNKPFSFFFRYTSMTVGTTWADPTKVNSVKVLVLVLQKNGILEWNKIKGKYFYCLKSETE